MEIWLKQGTEKITLPFLPNSYEIQSPQNNETLVTANGTEITLIGKRGLRTISWSSWFPKGKPDYVVGSYTGKPMSYMNKLGKMKGKIVDFMISGIANYQVTIENLTYGQDDGTGDIYYNIELKEYGGAEVEKTAKKQKKETVNKTSSKVKKPATTTKTKEVKSQTYIVKKGDTLTGIAKKLTGTSANWKAIYNANKKVIGSNPNKIYPGQKLVIKT